MVKKNDIPDPTQMFSGLLSGAAKESAQQVWLAGLGALAKAQQEGGRVFEALVREGTALQQQNPSEVGTKFAEAAARMTGFAAEAGAKPAQAWDRLESIFEERVAKALARLGMPSAAEVAALRAQVEALTARLDAMSPKPAAKKAARKRAAAKKA